MPNFTKQQQSAVDFDRGNCLVSAGAGSGKTAVLTARISELIKKGASLDEMLVLTFTNKAAYSMKAKTREVLEKSDDERVKGQIGKLDMAKIMTFDSFWLDLVNAYHYEIGIDHNVEISPENFLGVLAYRELDTLLNEYYDEAVKSDTPWRRVVGRYCVRNDDFLRSLILRIIKTAELTGDKQAYFASYDAKYFSREFIDAAIAELTSSCKANAVAYLDEVKKAYDLVETTTADEEYMLKIINAESFDDIVMAINDEGNPFPRLKTGEGKDGGKEIRNQAKSDYLDPIKKAAALGYADDIRDVYLSTREDVLTLLHIAEELDRRVSALKKQKGIFSFSDVTSLAIEVASKPEIQASLKQKYKYIMIDEYQDTSDIQEKLIGLISDSNVFCVGDIKQSIYRFRNANPTIFQSHSDNYAKGIDGTLITLPHNFRSRESAINRINEIFEKIMTRRVGDVDYTNGQALLFGNTNYSPSENDEAYGIANYRYAFKRGVSKAEQEATIIAEDILRKVGSFNCSDKDGNVHKASYDDFAILLPTKTNFADYQKVFSAYHIPLDVTGLQKDRYSDVLSVLKSILRFSNILLGNDKESNVRHYYASVARSFLLEKTDREIYNTLKDGNLFEEEWVKDLAKLLNQSKDEATSDIVLKVLNHLDVVNNLRKIGNFKANYETIESFLSASRFATKLGWSFGEFVSFFLDMDKFDVSFAIDEGKSDSKAVKLMTIHASKGLEFNVVYLPNIEKDFTKKGGSFNGESSFVTSNKYGIILKPFCGDTPLENIFFTLDKTHEEEATLSEQMRLFYVALTRTMELCVILLPKLGDEEEEKGHKYPKDCTLINSKTYYHFLKHADALDINVTDVDALPSLPPATLDDGGEDDVKLAFDNIVAPAKVAMVKRASKGIVKPIDEGKLAYGEKLHGYLEGVDFKNKDVSYIEDEREREIIEKVLCLPLFKDSIKAEAYKEYSFDNDGREAIIDLFLLYEDHIDLIDYKASNIDDPLYEEQLEVYEKFLKKAFGLPVNKYLLSIIKAEVKAL